MADEFALQIVGLRVVEAYLARALAVVAKPKDLLEAAAVLIASETGQNFRDGVDAFTGKKWKGLSSATISARRKGSGEGADKPLRDNGTLAAAVLNLSLQPPRASGDQVRIAVGGNKKGGDGITLGEIAAFHNGDPFGAPIRVNVITPVNAKVLTIPLSPEAKKAGSVKAFKAKYKKAYTGPGGVYIKKSKNAVPVQHWVFTKRSEVQQRRFMAITRKTIDRIKILFTDAIISAANGGGESE